jgi:anaerobic selenocysteine-containing dehydrogenase
VTARVVASACPLDCPDACSLDVHVRDGRVTRLEGNHRNPFTQGFICTKVRHFPRRMYGADRVLWPAVRRSPKGEEDPRFERISWDEALDTIAARIAATVERHGGEAVLPYSYGGSNGFLTQDAGDARFFRRLGASRLDRTVCAAPTGRAATGLYGKMPGVAFEDYPEARLIVVWGTNPSASGTHFVPIVLRAQAAGAKLVVVDPRATPLAKRADLHLAPLPGSDVALAMAVIRELFSTGRADLVFLAEHTLGWEELRRRAEPWTLERAAAVAGVAPASIERFADLYAASSPAVIRCGWGLERNRNGGSAVAAVLALPAVAGKFGVRGGGYTMSNSGAYRFGAPVAEAETTTRKLNMNELGRDLLERRDPPIEVLFVYNSNALVTTPHQAAVEAGLRRSGLFTVVHEQVWTDTARLADLVLPATTFLEHEELSRGYGAFVIHHAPAAVEPTGEAWSNNRLFAALERRLGLSRPGDEAEDQMVDRLLAGPRLAPARAELSAGGLSFPPEGTRPVQFVDSFPLTPDRKAHLVPAALDAEAPDGLYAWRGIDNDAAFPLGLISPATHHSVSSTLAELWSEPAHVALAAADADARGLVTGQRVRVWNERGEVHCFLRVSPDTRPGVAVLPKGLWRKHTLNGATATALAPDTLTDLGGGACFNDARVEVAAL